MEMSESLDCQAKGFSCKAHYSLVASRFAPADALTVAKASQIDICALGSTSTTCVASYLV